MAQTHLKPELQLAPTYQQKPIRIGPALDTTGWKFTSRPVVEAIDDKSGEIRFKILIDKEGVIESVLAVSSTVSAKQEALCRQALLKCHFERVGTKPGGTTGYYTFRISVR
ncbi:hypothetical protein GCM10022409_02620 [Hymenobacter glaciei]|uniref:TonB C-terminal domain-containing protein n=1 Tax=Hymenobacter glaciei TaxID=877209 RepID=A0ABP7T7W8_9BACT